MEPKKIFLLATKIAGIAVVLSTLVGIGFFYLNNIYRPDVQFQSIDEANGVAYLNIRGKDKMVYLDSINHIIGDWAVRVAATEIRSGGTAMKFYNRLELIKNGEVYGYIPF